MIRVRGDGRDYNFRLNVPRSVSRNSYEQSFKTKKDEWIEVTLPMDKFVATWRGRVFPNEKFVPSNITGMGIQLSDKKPGQFKLEVEWIKVGKTLGEMFKVLCEGTYQHHLQGVCTDETSVFWSFTTTLVKTGMEGTLLKQVPVATFANEKWWFGCYGDPKILLVTDADFNMLGRYEYDCSLGIVGLPNGQLLSASGKCEKDQGCSGDARLVVPAGDTGLRFIYTRR